MTAGPEMCGAVRTDDRQGDAPCVLDTHDGDLHHDGRSDEWRTEIPRAENSIEGALR